MAYGMTWIKTMAEFKQICDRNECEIQVIASGLACISRHGQLAIVALPHDAIRTTALHLMRTFMRMDQPGRFGPPLLSKVKYLAKPDSLMSWEDYAAKYSC
jgi:hypothetical protein